MGCSGCCMAALRSVSACSMRRTRSERGNAPHQSNSTVIKQPCFAMPLRTERIVCRPYLRTLLKGMEKPALTTQLSKEFEYELLLHNVQRIITAFWMIHL